MAGTTVTAAISGGFPGGFPGQIALAGDQLPTSSLNSFRVAAVAERLAVLFGSGQVNDPQFFHLCLSLARGIDYAVANNQAPETIRNIPLLLKQICQHRSNPFLQAAIMVLMISVKNACMIGWFSEKETEELLTLVNEIGSIFCSPEDINAATNLSLSNISTIMTRFYPLMKMGQILASLEVKPGYGVHVADFSISKKMTYSPGEKIRLFVAQKDNIETSTCIISPQHVNFLLNGKPVDRRTNVSMDPGPQLPTNVTSMLKYGTNLLQAVGQFNGHYLIVVAFMSASPSLDTPVLQEYVQPAVASLDSDSDIIEGPSRISLNCPISYRRIKTPVKGLSCKHLQCFDFSNFVDINSRRPSWRCPHCNQYLCYPDIRVDQNMVKVLKEVGDNVRDVIISADGSWKAIMETNDSVEQAQRVLDSEQQEPSSMSSTSPQVLDLTNDDDEMVAVDTYETEDIKPFLTDLHCQSTTPNLSTPPGFNISNGINQNVAAEVDDDFWSGLQFPPIATLDAQISSGISQPFPANSSSAPPLTDGVAHAHALSQESLVPGSADLSTSVSNTQSSAANTFELPTSQPNSNVSNGYRRPVSIPRHVSRTPLAFPALPVQSQVQNSQQRSGLNSSFLSSQPALPRAFSANQMQQQFSGSHMNPLQNWANQDRLFIPGQSVQQIGLPSSSQHPGAYRPNPSPLTEFQNSHLQQAFNRRMPPHSTSHSPSTVRPSLHVSPVEISQGSSTHMVRQSQTVPAQLQPSRTAPSSSINTDLFPNMGVVPQSVSRTDDLVDLSLEQNWRPTGRMRGSLHGPAYSAALSQFMMLQPMNPVQATRPSNRTSPLPDLPSVLVANSWNQPERSHDML